MTYRTSIWLLLIALGGCAVDRGPVQFRDPIPLITPETGKAVLYLLRVPREPFELVVHLDGQRTAALPKESFTAIALKPGTHDLLAVHPNPAVQSTTAKIAVSAGERRFFYSAIPTRGSVGMAVIPIGPMIVPIVTSSQTAVGARRWTEMTEFDAQGMLSVLSAVGAEANAP